MNTAATPSPTKEFDAIQTVYKALEPLDADGRQRVVNYIVSLFGLDSIVSEPEEVAVEGSPSANQNVVGLKFDTLADLYDAANPATNAEKALVVGAWLQDNIGHDSFSSQAINTELKHLGHGIANITNALEQLKDMKPAYIQQLRKSGSSQQARKTYKVTLAGIRAVKAMIEKAQTAG
jgi:hypothetical protein